MDTTGSHYPVVPDADVLAANLGRLTAGWSPTAGTGEETLATARRAIAGSLLGGRTLADIHAIRTSADAEPSISPLLADQLRQVASQAISAERPRTAAVIRSSLSATVLNPAGRPEWARSALVAQTFGPFEDAQGVPHWVDLIQLTRSAKFAFGTAASPFGVLPVKTTLLPLQNATNLTLGSGSVWFLSRLLANTFPTGQFAGLEISGGSITASKPMALQGDTWVIPANATLTVHLNPAPASPAGVGSIGPDAASASYAPPAKVTIAFHQTSASFEAVDDSEASAYGSNLRLRWNNKIPVPAPGLPAVLVPCTPSTPKFTFHHPHSKLFTPGGTAEVALAGWALSTTTAPVTALPKVKGAGACLLEFHKGASIRTHVSSRDAHADHGLLRVETGSLFVVLDGKAKPSRSIYQLWPEETPAKRNSTAEFTTAASFVFGYISTPAEETLVSSGRIAAHLDRPLSAAGSRFPYQADGFVAITRNNTGAHFFLLGSRLPVQAPIQSIALENALLGVDSSTVLFITGQLAGDAIASGSVGLWFPLRWLLPTLPDPYAANFGSRSLLDPASQSLGTLVATTKWSTAAPEPALTFQLIPSGSSATPGVATAGSEFTGLFNRRSTFGVALLDLSTSVDLFGVATFPAAGRLLGDDRSALTGIAPGGGGSGQEPAPAMAFTGLRLALNGAVAATFALPQVSWEPMESTATPNGPIYCDPPSDGLPLLVSAPDNQQLVPFMPGPVLTNNIDNVAAGKSFVAAFSLPFGLNAVIAQHNRPVRGRRGSRSLFHAQGGEFRSNQPTFPETFAPGLLPSSTQVTGALQLTLKPPFPERTNARFAGQTSVDSAHGPHIGGPPDGYGHTVIGLSPAPGFPGVGGIFEDDFGSGGAVPGVPLRRIDFSGYGASIFSEWSDPTAVPPAIIKVDFETSIGRTGHEVIQAASVIYPYGPRVVRTVTMQRQNAGWVQRTDTGWQPASHGLFQFPPDPPHGVDWSNSVHLGPIEGAFNIRNIREQTTGEIIPNPLDPAHPFKFVKVLFDADFGINRDLRVLQGGFQAPVAGVANPPVLVASRDIVGYLQVEPNRQTPDQAILQQLLARTGPLTPSIHCTVEAGHQGAQPGTVLRCSAVEVNAISHTNTGAKVPALGVALRGAPQIPRGGGWSLGRRKFTEPAPTALPSDFPLPLVRPATVGNFWYLADTADILQLTQPDNFYSLMHATGTNKILFESPQIPTAGGVPGLQFPKPIPAPPKPGAAPANTGSPNLGDIASILNSTGLFPDIANAISLLQGPMEQINSAAQGFKYSKTMAFDPNQRLPLIDLGIIAVELQYADTTTPALPPAKLVYSVDSSASPSWSLSIGTLSFLVTIPIFGSSPVLTITGGFKADEHTKAGLTDLNVQMGDALSVVKGVFSRLQTLAQFLPGGGGANLDVALSNGHLTVSESFSIEHLPLGLGTLQDISLELGLSVALSPISVDFTVGIGSPDKPFNWIVSPLAGTGMMVFGVRQSKPALTIQAGIGLGLAIDLGIASGSASVTIAVQLDITGNKITLMAILTGRASVDVLGGLASASLTLSAALGFSLSPIIPPLTFSPPLPAVPTSVTLGSEEITLLAVCSVGIHISICWVISISWDGSWKFSQSVNTPELTVSL